jgi:plasmid replication initiation protein
MENNLIYKSNALIEASYALTLNEQRLLLACISQVDSSKPLTETKLFILTVEQARDLFYGGSERDHAYRDLSTACDKLFEREVTLRTDAEPHKRLRTRFVQSVRFDDKKQEVQLRFSYDILPYISQLKDNFTRYRVENMVQLTSTHAIRIYELIVMWFGQNQSYKELELNEFKDLLGLGMKYKQSSDLNTRVLEPTLTQINTYTDFNLEINLRKIGRSFTHIQLRFNRKTDAIESDQQRIKAKQSAAKRIAKPKETESKKMIHPVSKSTFIGVELTLLKQIQKQHPEISEKYIRDYAEQTEINIVQALEKIKSDYKAAEQFSLEKSD